MPETQKNRKALGFWTFLIKHYNQSFIYNSLMFQVIWWLAILMGNRSALVVAVLLGLHFLLVKAPKTEALLILGVALPGILVDSFLAKLGVFIFPGDQLLLGSIPVWLWSIWLGFGASLQLSLMPILSRHLMLKLVSPFFAVASYLAAEGFGVVEFSKSFVFMVCLLGAIWVVLLVWIVYWYERVSK